MAFSSVDHQLLNEAYSAQLLKESFSEMTLGQVVANLDEFNQSELEWVEQFSERVIDNLFPEELVLEFWGGAKAVAKGAGGGIGKAGKGLFQRGKNAVSNAAQGVKAAGQQVGQGVKAAGQQVGQNVKDIYNSAEDSKTFDKGAKKAQEVAMELAELVKSAQEKGLITFSGDPMTMPLGELVDELIQAQKGSANQAKGMQKNGAFEGMGRSFKKGFQG